MQRYFLCKVQKRESTQAGVVWSKVTAKLSGLGKNGPPKYTTLAYRDYEIKDEMGRISTRIQYTLDALFSHSSTTSSQASIFLFLLKEPVAAIADSGAFHNTVSLELKISSLSEFSRICTSDHCRWIFLKGNWDCGKVSDKSDASQFFLSFFASFQRSPIDQSIKRKKTFQQSIESIHPSINQWVKPNQTWFQKTIKIISIITPAPRASKNATHPSIPHRSRKSQDESHAIAAFKQQLGIHLSEEKPIL